VNANFSVPSPLPSSSEMSIAVALWSLPLPAGKKVKFHAVGDVRITNAALDADIADANARSVVKFTYELPQPMDEDDDDEEEEPKMEKTTTILCALTPGKIEQATLDLILTEEDDFVFENVGKNLIYLTGNYIEQPHDEPPEGYDSDDSDDDEGYPLQDVSSDVEIDPRELDLVDSDSDDEKDDSHRFEEVKDKDAPKSKKRPRDSEAAEAEGEEKKPSKKEKKTLKKQKADDGKAVPSGESNGEEKPPKEKKEKKADKEDDLKELPSGLQMMDVKVGSGKVAKKGDMVSMRYFGKFTDGKVFDKNIKGKPFSFKLGAGEVIKGWDEGIVGMSPGGERLLIVPPKLGYGNRKIDGIPAGSTLRFECKLIEIK